MPLHCSMCWRGLWAEGSKKYGIQTFQDRRRPGSFAKGRQAQTQPCCRCRDYHTRCAAHTILRLPRHVYHTFLKFELHGGPLLRVTSRSAVNIALRDIEHPLEFRCRRVSSGGLIIGKTGETNLTCRSTYRHIVNCKPLSIPAILCR